jgi:hypothetical protein
MAEVGGDLSSRVAVRGHQRRHPMPELMRGGPRYPSTLGCWGEHVAAVVAGSMSVSVLEGKIASCGAEKRTSALRLVRRRTVCGDSGIVRTPAEVLASGTVNDGLPEASVPTCDQRARSASEAPNR